MISAIGNKPVLASGDTLPLSPAVRAGDFLFISGQLGLDDDGKLVGEDIASQTRQAIARIESILAMAGGRHDQIIKTSVWLTENTISRPGTLS